MVGYFNRVNSIDISLSGYTHCPRIDVCYTKYLKLTELFYLKNTFSLLSALKSNGKFFTLVNKFSNFDETLSHSHSNSPCPTPHHFIITLIVLTRVEEIDFSHF